MLRAVGIQAENKSNATGSWILLTKDGDGGDDGNPPENGSKADDASTKEGDASTVLPPSNPDTYGNPESNGRNGSICGHPLGSLSRTEEDKGDEKDGKPPAPLKVAENASIATNASIGGPKPYAFPATPDVGSGVQNGAREGSVPPRPSPPVEDLFSDPPDWLAAQLDKCREDERVVNPTCSSVAYQLFGTAERWTEVEPVLRRRLAEGGRA